MKGGHFSLFPVLSYCSALYYHNTLEPMKGENHEKAVSYRCFLVRPFDSYCMLKSQNLVTIIAGNGKAMTRTRDVPQWEKEAGNVQSVENIGIQTLLLWVIIGATPLVHLLQSVNVAVLSIRKALLPTRMIGLPQPVWKKSIAKLAVLPKVI